MPALQHDWASAQAVATVSGAGLRMTALCGHGGEDAACGYGQREVPRRDHDHRSVRDEAGPFSLERLDAPDGLGVVASEIDGLGHLRVRFGNRVAAVAGHDTDQPAPAGPQGAGDGAHAPAPIPEGPGPPLFAGPGSGGDSVVHP